MKRLSVYLASFAIMALMLGACGKKHKTVEIGDLVNYTDSTREFSMKIPGTFIKTETAGKRLFLCSSKEDQGRFSSYAPEGTAGVVVTSEYTDLTDSMNLDAVINNAKIFKEGYKPVEQTTVAGMPASKLTLEFELTDGMFHSEKYFVANNNVVTTITFSSFCSSFDKYKAKFDEILNSVKPAGPRKVATGNVQVVQTEQPYPDEPVTVYSGAGFSIGRPSNMTATATKTGNTIASVNMISMRRSDCSIQVDVMNSKKSDLNFYKEQFKATYKTSPRDVKVGSFQGASFDYSFSKDTKSRAYIAVNGNGKAYRITMNWYAPEQDKYLPLFEKAISMFKGE